MSGLFATPTYTWEQMDTLTMPTVCGSMGRIQIKNDPIVYLTPHPNIARNNLIDCAAKD
jgi:hypothetical protein